MPGGTRRSPADRSGLPVCSRTRRPSSGGSKGPRADYPPPAGAPDPLAADPPFHPSYEDRAGAPDRVFARVDDDAYERLVAAWIEHPRAGGGGGGGGPPPPPPPPPDEGAPAGGPP